MADDNDQNDQNGPGEFFSSLSEENQALPGAEKFKTVDNNAMFKSYNELESVVGKKGVILPKEGDAEDLVRFNTETGGFYDSTKFELPDVSKEQAESLRYSQDAWKQLCADMGVRPDQAKIGQERILEKSKNTVEQMQARELEAFGKADQLVRAEMGEDYDLNMSRVEKLTMGNAGSEESGKRLFESVKKDPEAFQALSKIAGLLSENSIGKISPLSAGKSPDQARARIAEIQADPNYLSDSEDLRQPLITEMNDLDRIIMGAEG